MPASQVGQLLSAEDLVAVIARIGVILLSV